MLAASRGGDGWLWYAMAVVLLLFGGASRFAALGALGLAGASSILLFQRLKKLTGRKRPCTLEPHCWATLLPPDQFSFPSGHTMSAFAAATSITMFYPSLAAGVFFCAVSIALSRVILGMHFLSDVVAGALIGAALGYGSALLFI
jgi:undecaprenyl-diphosphatase